MARLADPDRRETILRAATEVFLEQGYSEARLADIAQRAGVVISTLYLYFSSKEEMVHAITELSRPQLLEQIRPVLEHLCEEKDIVQFVEIICTYLDQHSDELRIFLLDSGLSSVRQKSQQQLQGTLLRRGEQIIRRLIDENVLYPYEPSLVIKMLFGFSNWMIEHYTRLEDEEKAPFKAFCVQWLSNALLLPERRTR